METSNLDYHKNIKAIHTTFENLSLNDLEESNNNQLVVTHEETRFYFRLFLKENNDKLIVFPSGLRVPSKNVMPYFSRATWHQEFDSNCLFISDPTLQDTNYALAWSVGYKEHYHLETVSKIIKKILFLLSVESKDTTYFGTSSGGFISLMLATLHKNSNAIVNNPQFYVDKERAFNFFRLLNNDIDRNVFFSTYYIRFSFFELLDKTGYFPNIEYILNYNSETDVVKQYYIILDFLKKNKSNYKKIQFTLYYDENGHNGLYPKNKVIQFINQKVESNLQKKVPILDNNSGYLDRFSVFDDHGKLIESIVFRDFIFVPKTNFKKGYSVKKDFKINIDYGRVYFKIHNHYKSIKAVNIFEYEIHVNDVILSKEDIASNNTVNEVLISNLKKNDVVSIRIQVLRGQKAVSWSNASKVKIYDFQEINDEEESLDKFRINYSSPDMFNV